VRLEVYGATQWTLLRSPRESVNRTSGLVPSSPMLVDGFALGVYRNLLATEVRLNKFTDLASPSVLAFR